MDRNDQELGHNSPRFLVYKYTSTMYTCELSVRQYGFRVDLWGPNAGSNMRHNAASGSLITDDDLPHEGAPCQLLTPKGQGGQEVSDPVA